MREVKFQLGAEVQLFNTGLVGMIDSESGCIIIRQPTAGFDAPSISIAEFIDQLVTTFTNLGLPKPEVKFPDAIAKATEGVSVAVNEIYLKIMTKDPKSVEFAIWVSMSTSEELQKAFPGFVVKKGYLKLWSTADPDILREMQISQVADMFNKAKAELAAEQLPEKTEKKTNT